MKYNVLIYLRNGKQIHDRLVYDLCKKKKKRDQMFVCLYFVYQESDFPSLNVNNTQMNCKKPIYSDFSKIIPCRIDPLDKYSLPLPLSQEYLKEYFLPAELKIAK